MNFDPDDYSDNFERDFKETTMRLGASFSPSPASNLLLSFIYSDREEEQTDGSSTLVSIPFPPFSFTNTQAFAAETKEKAYQPEIQYIHAGEAYNVTAGAAYAHVEQNFKSASSTTFTPPVFPAPPASSSKDKPEIDDARGYVYGNFNMPVPVTWTLGLSYQDYDEDAFSKTRANPKVGVQWDITDSLRLRGAYFKVIKPALASNRTLEPTQVAGFNQFFDDSNGTKSTRFGGGLDWRVTQSVAVGAEATRRKMDTPEFIQSGNSLGAKFDEQDEWYHRAYANWTPADRWSVSAEAIYDKYESDKPVDLDQPLEVRTISFPVRVQYFHPTGYFGGVGVSYVDQEVDRSSLATLSDGDDNFTVTDLSLGYRLPRRAGIVSLTVQNIFDKEFDYQDDSYREFQDEPSIGPYIPDRAIVGRVSLNF
jgi:outer membrane receptor for ferric coprogen and ferric-rhodotorulic acid